jgi:multidrug efflux pump subunit AcrA (membrane-fusion protein)
MYAEATLYLEQRKNALALPVQALNRNGGKTTVLKIAGGNKVEEQPVKLGLETSSEVEIISGLKENDLVVVGGQGQLRTGQTVRPKVTEIPAVREES